MPSKKPRERTPNMRFPDFVLIGLPYALGSQQQASFRGAPTGRAKARRDGASPESITTIGVYGFRACAKRAHPGMTGVGVTRSGAARASVRRALRGPAAATAQLPAS